jgi:hypothetical protein
MGARALDLSAGIGRIGAAAAVAEPAPAAAGAGLDNHWARSDPPGSRTHARSVSGEPCERSTTRVVLGNGRSWTWLRCGNRRCERCDRREAMELARVLQLDALVRPIEALLTLTTKNPADAKHGEKFRRSMERVVKALRRRWPHLSYCAFIEFTTGKSERSGGHRRMHAHVLLRGLEVKADDEEWQKLPQEQRLEAVRKVASKVWCARMGTADAAQDIRPIDGFEALATYLAHHHRKREQAPPDWWRGMRTRASQNWWSRPIAELRQEAREQLRLEQVRWLAATRVQADIDAGRLIVGSEEEFRALVGERMQTMEKEREASPPWRVWDLGWDDDGVPVPWFPRPTDGGKPKKSKEPEEP